MIEGLGRSDAVHPERGGERAKEPGSSFIKWLEEKAAKAAERNVIDNGAGVEMRDAAATIDLHFQRGQKSIEIVSVPWRLKASGRLSQISSGYAAIAAAPVTDATPITTNSRVVKIPSFLASNVPAASACETFEAQRALVRSAELAGHRTAIDAGDMDAQLPSRPAETMVWAERLLRWLERQGHGPELWIRDYALDEKTAESVADGIRALAQERGVCLERIVVNGRELWLAPHLRRENI